MVEVFVVVAVAVVAAVAMVDGRGVCGWFFVVGFW